MQHFQTKTSPTLLLLLVLATAATVVLEASPVPAIPSEKQLENAFADAAVVEDIVLCFEGKKKCSPEQDKIRVQADAMIKNFGKCPPSICSAQDLKRMEFSMDLLVNNYPELFGRMVAAMLDVPISR